MNAVEILDRLNGLGVSVTVQGEALLARPGSKVPPDMMSELREHKPEILEHLRRRDEGHVRRRYHLRYAGDGLAHDEMAEIVRHVESEGWVLLWSETVSDFIGVYDTDADRCKIPPGFVLYSGAELLHLFGADQSDLSDDTIRRLHHAKVLGANIAGSYPEGEDSR